MKEIIDRIQENKQIELAKSILESEGYKITKKNVREAEDARGEISERKKKMIENPVYKKMDEICKRAGYRLSSAFISSGYINIDIRKGDRSDRYAPDIYWYDRKFGQDTQEFEIQTTSYGAMNLEEHTKFLERVTAANTMVTELSKLDLTKLADLTEE